MRPFVYVFGRWVWPSLTSLLFLSLSWILCTPVFFPYDIIGKSVFFLPWPFCAKHNPGFLNLQKGWIWHGGSSHPAPASQIMCGGQAISLQGNKHAVVGHPIGIVTYNHI